MNSKFRLLLSKQEEESKYKISIHKTNLKLKKCLKIISLYFLTYIINIAPSIYQKKNFVYIYDYPTSKNPQIKQERKTNTKIALCTIGKKENLYAKEFIQYYINLGVDHIYIYDDNDPNTERISDIIEPKYQSQVTTILTKDKNITHQSMAFDDCYRTNNKNYDWFIILDMDEFLYIKNNTLENYLSDDIFNKCDIIRINWVISLDNDLLYYDPRTQFERFKPPYLRDKFIKCITRGNIDDLRYWVHSPRISPTRNVSCNNKGDVIVRNKVLYEALEPINIEKAFIIHFRFRSTEELINKNKRGFGEWLHDLEFTLMSHINDYFQQNRITMEKVEYIEKELKLNLWKFKLQYYFQKLFFI